MTEPADPRELRRTLRAARRALTPFERQEKSQAIFQQLSDYLPFRKAERVAIYWATAEEVATEPAMDYSAKLGKSLYLPVIKNTGPGNALMEFHYYQPGETMLTPNRFGIPEPDCPDQTMGDSRPLDVILVPVVGFNERCERIGMGGGYYDRYLAQQSPASTDFVGLAFSCQQAIFDARQHDVSLHAIITEDGIIER